MKLVYLAHPVAAPTHEGVKANLDSARRWHAWALFAGVSPQTPYIPAADLLPDENPYLRMLGINADLECLKACAEVWLCGERVSPGMFLEALTALDEGIPVYRYRRQAPEPVRVDRAALFDLVGIEAEA